jgi:hypothetical protein
MTAITGSTRGASVTQPRLDPNAIASIKLNVLSLTQVAPSVGIVFGAPDLGPLGATGTLLVQPSVAFIDGALNGTLGTKNSGAPITVKFEVKTELPKGSPLTKLTNGITKVTFKGEMKVVVDRDPKKPGNQSEVVIKVGMFVKNAQGVESNAGPGLEWSNNAKDGFYGFRMRGDSTFKPREYKNNNLQSFEKTAQLRVGGVTVSGELNIKQTHGGDVLSKGLPRAIINKLMPLSSEKKKGLDIAGVLGLALVPKKNIPGPVWELMGGRDFGAYVGGKGQIGIPISPGVGIAFGIEGAANISAKVDGEDTVELVVGPNKVLNFSPSFLIGQVTNGIKQSQASLGRIPMAATELLAHNKLTGEQKEILANRNASIDAKNSAADKLRVLDGLALRLVKKYPTLLQRNESGIVRGNADVQAAILKTSQFTIDLEARLLRARVNRERSFH